MTIDAKKIFIPLFLFLFCSLAFASTNAVMTIANELQQVSGKFELLPKNSQQKLKALSIFDLSESAIKSSLSMMEKEMDKSEVFEKVFENAVGIYDEKNELEGFIVLPVTFLAVPEGDTDYYVYYYSFFSGKDKFETQFKVYKPLY